MIYYIGEYAGWAAEYFILKFYDFVDGYIVLNLTSVADFYVRAYHHVLTNWAVFSYPGTL